MKDFVLYYSSEAPQKITKEILRSLPKIHIHLDRILMELTIIMQLVRSVKILYNLRAYIRMEEYMVLIQVKLFQDLIHLIMKTMYIVQDLLRVHMFQRMKEKP